MLYLTIWILFQFIFTLFFIIHNKIRLNDYNKEELVNFYESRQLRYNAQSYYKEIIESIKSGDVIAILTILIIPITIIIAPFWMLYDVKRFIAKNAEEFI